MPSLIHEGVRYVQTSHAVQCKQCGEIVESKSNHDYRMCKCNTVGVDGGITCTNRVIGDPLKMRDVSKWRTEKRPYVWLPQSVLDERLEAICKKILAQRWPA